VLIAYSWPGNVRELENVVEYAVNMETGSDIRSENLPDRITKNRKKERGTMTLREKTDEYQRMLIGECLNETGRSTEEKIIAAKRRVISEIDPLPQDPGAWYPSENEG
jgi:transcriptional regulator with PAS, ATPase and Fis domain